MTGVDAPAPGDTVPGTNDPPRRPASVMGGALLMVARAITGGFVILTVLSRWDEFEATVVVEGDRLTPVDASAAATVLGWLLAGYGLLLVLYLGLTALVFTGRNWARVLAMSMATVSILISFTDYALNGAQITLRTSLVSVTIDILILLALSSTNARHYARAVRTRRLARLTRPG